MQFIRTKLQAAEDEVSHLKAKLRKNSEENKEKLRELTREYDQKLNVGKEDKSHSTMSPPRPTTKERNRTGYV